ncbi:hypothetical protein [Streptomyces sp. NPDC001340]
MSVPRRLLSPQGLGPRIVNLEQWGWHITDAVQAESVRNPVDRLRRPPADLAEPAPARPRESPAHLGFAVLLRLRAAGPDDDRELTLITTLTQLGTATDVRWPSCAWTPSCRWTGRPPGC